MASIDHIKSLRLKNFKCFEDFTMDNIGQFNLIVGANNSGKTSLLEGLLLTDPFGESLLVKALLKRSRPDMKADVNKSFDFLDVYRNSGSGPISISTVDANDDSRSHSLNSVLISEAVRDSDMLGSLKQEYGDAGLSRLEPNQRLHYWVHSGPPKNEGSAIVLRRITSYEQHHPHYHVIPYITAVDLYDSDLIDNLSAIQRSKILEDEFKAHLRMIVPDLEDVKLSTDISPFGISIGLRLKDQNSLIPLSMFGDGTVRLFRLLTELLSFELDLAAPAQRIVLIDEVDYGFHRGKLLDFWKKLIEIAHRLNIQLFMTTHNEECVRTFWEAFESEELKNRWGVERDEVARHFILERDKDNVPRSYSVPLSHLGHALDAGNDIMGFA
jgi:hypothetical protein